MPIYRIADLNVEVNPKFKICRKRLESYAVKSNESGKTDIAISVSDDEIRERLRLSDNLSEQGAEDVLILSKFCNAVLDGFDGFFFHSSCLELDGEGYVFSAVSGTGKSTHTALWMGKADIGTNTKAPVKAVYILQRAEENTAVRVLPSQVMKQLLEATVIDVERSRMEKLLELLDEFFKETPLFLLGCNMDESAVMTAYNAANGG